MRHKGDQGWHLGDQSDHPRVKKLVHLFTNPNFFYCKILKNLAASKKCFI